MDEANTQQKFETEPISREPSMEDSTVPFLLHSENNFPSKTRRGYWVWLFHGILLCINALIFLSLIHEFPHRTERSFDTLYSPARDAIENRLETWNLSLGDISPYTAPPSAEVDALWDKISADGHVGGIVVQKSDLDRLGKTSIKLQDGSGYLGIIDVFHQLHCLNYLRRVIYNDTYQMTLEEDPVPHAHIPHCIDSLRMSLQCSADTSLVTFRWLETYPWPWPDFGSVHECRNWEKIVDWANVRNGDLRAVLVHPILGMAGKEAFNVSNIPLRAEDRLFVDDEGRRVEG